MEGITARSPWRDYTGAIVVAGATLAFAVVSATHLVQAQTVKLFANHAMTVLPFLAGLLAFWAARRQTGRERYGWILLGFWGLLSATGNGIWEYYELVALREVPFPSLADYGYLGGNLCAIAAIAMFAISSKRASTLRTVIDAMLIASSIFVVSWSLVLHTTYHDAEGNLLSQVVGLAYPILDVIIVSLVVFVASSSSVKARVPLVIAGIGFLGWAFSDTAFAYLTSKGTYATGMFVDAGWIGGDALIALAAFTVIRSRGLALDHTESESSRWRVHLPYIVGGAALIVGTIAQIFHPGNDPIILFCLVALLLLIVIRQFLLTLESQAMTIERMRSVDEMKNGILRAVSHELRTPLTFIKGAALMLEEDEDLPKEIQRDMFTRLVRNADRLEEFLTGLLDLERLTRGVLEPARRRTEMTGVLSRMAANVDHANHSIKINGTSEVWANIDSAQVERIVENLFVNAVRHTPEGTTVEARAERTSEGVLITVSDDGPGVPEEIRELIFEPFAQAEDSIKAGRGTGIGLALVAKFAELHGGNAWVEAGPAGGASFKVLLGDDSIAHHQAA